MADRHRWGPPTSSHVHTYRLDLELLHLLASLPNCLLQREMQCKLGLADEVGFGLTQQTATAAHLGLLAALNGRHPSAAAPHRATVGRKRH